MPRGQGGRGGGRGSMRGGRRNYSGNTSFRQFNNGGGLFSSLRNFFFGNNLRSGAGNSGGFGNRGDGMGGVNRGMKNFDNYNAGYPYEETYNNMHRDTERYNNQDMCSSDNNQPQTEAEQLKEKARQINKELQNIQSRIKVLESENPASTVKVIADKGLCTGCGICENACPKRAITVREFAEIDMERCTLCGGCINACPANALQIVKL